MEAPGIELEFGRKPDLVAPRDFGRNGFEIQRVPPPFYFLAVLSSPLESPKVLEKYWRRQGRFPPPGLARRIST